VAVPAAGGVVWFTRRLRRLQNSTNFATRPLDTVKTSPGFLSCCNAKGKPPLSENRPRRYVTPGLWKAIEVELLHPCVEVEALHSLVAKGLGSHAMDSRWNVAFVVRVTAENVALLLQAAMNDVSPGS
jgi:hypothetical protein